ncbi:MAG: hypothetical protein ACRENE_27875 [Polyangiaceae bacterium]
MPELKLTTQKTLFGVDVQLNFDPSEDMDLDAYPVEATLRVYAKFKGHPDLRSLDREIIISPAGPPPPPRPPPVLLPTPTFLRVISRQPVKLLSGGPAAHVRLRWDGQDSLATGPLATWRFQAKCLTLSTFPTITFSAPTDGRFELLLDTPNGILPNQTLDFEVEAIGQNGGHHRTKFQGLVAAPEPKPEPRKVQTLAPEASAQRRPPYELRYVHKSDWGDATCWGDSAWTKDDPGSLAEPTDSSPLTLMINDEAEDVQSFKDALIKRNLDESTVKDRVTRYTTHVAFHLYQMYLHTRVQKEKQEADAEEGTVRVPSDQERRSEIQRVARTLLKVMEVSR